VTRPVEYQDLFERAPDCCLVTDAEGVILCANRAAEELLQAPGSRLEGRRLDGLVVVPEREDVRAGIEGVREHGRVTTWELPILLEDGTGLRVDASVGVLGSSGKRMCWLLRDVTERSAAQERAQVQIELLRHLVEDRDLDAALGAALQLLQRYTGCEALAIRLREGEDFPYFATRGFSPDFVAAETRLSSSDACGNLIRDRFGRPVLECLCGSVICERVDPSQPFFTERGSFWTNSTTQFLETTTEEERQGRTRDRCNGEGYESVALVPLRRNQEIFGLIQLNDPREGRFTPGLVAFLEELSGFVAAVLA